MTIPTEYYRVIRRISSLVCYWRLNDLIGTSAVDRAGKYNLNGIYNGSPTNGFPLIYATIGEVGAFAPGSKLFGSSGMNMEVPSVSSIQIVSDITIEMWIMAATVNSTCSLLNKMNSTTSPAHPASYSLGMSSGKIVFQLGNGTTQVSLTSSSAISPGAPTHIVATCFKGKMNIIINGISSNTTTLGSQEVRDLGKPLYIGALPNNTERFNGIIGEVALYNGGMSILTAKTHFSVGRQIIFNKPYYTTYDIPSYS